MLKLSVLLIALAAAPASADEVLHPPSGPVHVDDAPPARTQKPKRARLAKRLARIIQRWDRNGDGSVGPGELPPRVAARLRRLDRNGDGWIDRRDFRGKGRRARPAPAR